MPRPPVCWLGLLARTSPIEWDDQLTDLFGLSDGSVVDGAQGGNATRHLNHACAPNVEAVERYADDGELELAARLKEAEDERNDVAKESVSTETRHSPQPSRSRLSSRQ